ncbi:antitoxin BrnA [Candidatus Termititenax persephonae]|uniref:Antitoxin BrnA n=1 Tax=Candidatus Termititenax persephonae TaxID=2218525 RepID=A0A388TJN6_9BACT|nr:antitoxin BrnA [Candidatus Termititenax persephonae]
MEREPTQEDMRDPDLLTPTKEMLKNAVRLGRPPKLNPKKSVYIYFESDVVRHLRATGKGWQTRVSDWVAQGVRQGAL